MASTVTAHERDLASNAEGVTNDDSIVQAVPGGAPGRASASKAAKHRARAVRRPKRAKLANRSWNHRIGATT